MFRVGNRVAPFFNMGKKGTVIEMREISHQTWMVNGSAGHAWILKIEFDNGDVAEHSPGDLMPIDD